MKIKDLIFKIEDISFDQVLKYLVESTEKKGKKLFVTTINPELIMIAKGDSEYEKVLMSSDLAVPDGVGILWAGKIFGKKFKERIHGVDLVEKLSEAISEKPITVGFVGGHENVAQLASDCLRKKYPGLKVAFAQREWEDIQGKKSADILFLALGSPKQEKWIYENLPKIDVRVAMGVGGAFDFISGNVKRAPKWMRRIGLEWLFRLIIQPWRWERQIALIKFVLLVLKEKFFG